VAKGKTKKVRKGPQCPIEGWRGAGRETATDPTGKKEGKRERVRHWWCIAGGEL